MAQESDEAVPRWVAVTDRLPPEEERVLVFLPDWGPEGVIALGWVERLQAGKPLWELSVGGDALTDAVTHWMPLPSPPR